MGVFLKMIGSGKSPCPEPYTEPYADFSPSRPPKRVHVGDHLVLYAAGGRKCVFAIARVTSEGYASGISDWPHRLDIEYLIRVSPADGVPANEVSMSRDLTQSVKRHTCISISQEEYDRAVAMLEEDAG